MRYTFCGTKLGVRSNFHVWFMTMPEQLAQTEVSSFLMFSCVPQRINSICTRMIEGGNGNKLNLERLC